MANTKYDPYEDIKKWTYNKGLYDDAVKRGDKAAQKAATDNGMASYFNLQNNGYADLAKTLGDTDYAGAKKIENQYLTKNKVAIRPYLYNSKLKNQYKLSDSDIDSLLSFNESTGEVSLGGMNLGSPFSNVDGVTYWDSGVLDKAIDDYISFSGITPGVSKSDIAIGDSLNVSQNAQALFGLQESDHKDMTGKYDELYDYAMHENPLETPTGKAIMDDYRIKGAQAADNEKASSASSNGGNIDSYAQANANRQQAAMTAKGQQMAIAAQSQRIADVRAVLGDLGAYQKGSYDGMLKTIGAQQGNASRLFEEEQAEKLNENQIDYNIAAVTGYVPTSYEIASNRYFTDGKLTNPELDYGIIIEDTRALLEKEQNPEQKAILQKQLNDALIARAYKTSPDNYGGKWSRYAKDMSGYVPTPTQQAIQSQYDYSAAELEAFNKLYEQNSKDAQSAVNNLESYMKNGIPITQPMLDAAGFSDYTPDSFTAAYLNNKKNIAASGKVYTGTTPKAKDKLSYSAKQGIYDYIMGENYTPEGLKARLSSYDWDKYDSEDAKEWMVSNFANDDEVFETVNNYFGIDETKQAEPTTSDGEDDGENSFDIDAYAKKLADKINGVYEADSEESVFNPIQSASGGMYRVDGVAANRVIKEIIEDTNVPDDDKARVLALFGITDEQIYSYINNENYD